MPQALVSSSTPDTLANTYLLVSATGSCTSIWNCAEKRAEQSQFTFRMPATPPRSWTQFTNSCHPAAGQRELASSEAISKQSCMN
eukprot:8465577-Pyramimonas_sp.AAC.1